ncbi:MAG: aldo/keto reductase, partial [Candidatus Lokiarchaeota archaeon]
MIRYGIDNGINYIDTAWPYHNGESEIVVGEALKYGYREKVKLVTKLPIWEVKSPKDFDIFLNKQLEKLQTDHLDAYLIHAMDEQRFQIVKDNQIIAKMEEARDKGLIKYIGFSFHDSYKTFKKIIDYFDWDLAQIQYNYLDVN